MPNGEIPRPGESPQKTLRRLRHEEKKISQLMQGYSLNKPDQSGFADLFYRLEDVRVEIERLTSSIPSAGPSPTTIDSSNQDPQGTRPWRGQRRVK